MVAGQADDALHQQLAQLIAVKRDDVAPLRRGIGHHEGQPPAQEQGLGGHTAPVQAGAAQLVLLKEHHRAPGSGGFGGGSFGGGGFGGGGAGGSF